KTTTIDTIMGLLPSRSGVVRFKGQEVTRWPAHERARMGIGYAPEDCGIFPDLTVEENFQITAWLGKETPTAAPDGTIFAIFPEIKEFLTRRCLHLCRGGRGVSTARGQRMQDVDRPADVQPLSQPAGHGRPSVQVKSLRLMPRSQHVEGISWQRSNSRNLGKKSPVRTAEAQLSVGVSLDLVALFVNRAVMPTTENSEIRKCGRAAIRPVTDVMPLAETEAATREAAAAIAMVK